MTYILGLNAYHGDSSACLIHDGRLVAAAEEERFRRIKHWAGFPSEAIRYCLNEASIPLSKVDHLAVNSAAASNLLRKIGFTLRNRPDFSFVMERLKNAGARAGIGDELTQAFPGDHFGGVIHRVEHHLAHLASTFLVSPFDEAAAVSVDGFGDFASAAWGIGRGTRVEVSDRVYFPHSLGIFYMAMTQYLGFPHWGDEYKVMGLAPYGQPTCVKELEQVVRLAESGKYELEMRFFKHHKEKLQEWPGSAPHVARIFTEALEELLGPARDPASELTQRHRDIARSTQVVYENAFFHLLQSVHRQYPVDAIALAGGCAMNSVANGKIYDRSPFKRAYVQAAAGDAGGAIGAALSVWQGLNGSARPELMNHAYWGPGFATDQIEACLASHQGDIQAQGCRLEHVDEGTLLRRVAQAIADGQVVGWFQGRMEWGPRALGNRSILADPRRADMKDTLNLKIKRRESFRPFAPSILREAVPAWFETDDDVPFMTQVFQIRSECRARIPAVTHVDGSGRLQTVSRDANPRYYALIEQFNALTSVPIVLNTSFNENEPIVCVPEQALDCFLRTRMDMLALGDRLLTRDGAAASQ